MSGEHPGLAALDPALAAGADPNLADHHELAKGLPWFWAVQRGRRLDRWIEACLVSNAYRAIAAATDRTWLEIAEIVDGGS